MKNENVGTAAMELKKRVVTGVASCAMAMTLGVASHASAADAPKADSAAPAKIAIVDIEKAIKQTTAGQKMSKDLQTEFEKKKSEFTKRDGDLRKMFEDLEKKKSLLTDEARQKKAMELQQEQMKFQKEVADSQTGIQKKEREMLEPIAKKMEEIIDRVAKDGGYTAILDRRAILWGSKSADLTDAVVKEFEKAKK